MAIMNNLKSGVRPDWPVTVVGRFESLIVVRRPSGTIAAQPITRLTRGGILDLFDGDGATLRRLFPSEGGHGWCPDRAAEAVMAASYAAGDVDPASLGLVPIYRWPRYGGPTVVLVPKPRTAPATTIEP